MQEYNLKLSHVGILIKIDVAVAINTHSSIISIADELRREMKKPIS